MPADSPRNATARQLELLQELPSTSPGKSATLLTRALANRGYPVSKRTMERDLLGLQQLSLAERSTGSEPHGWRSTAKGAMLARNLSTTDALTLHLLDRFLQPILPAAMTRQLKQSFDLAAQRLAEQGPANALSAWAGKVAVVSPGPSVIPADIDAFAMQIVQEALLNNERVEVSYRSAEADTPRIRVLHPLGLVLCGPTTYLVATTDRHFPKPATYAMHRLRSARRLHDPARVPKDFSLQAFIDAGGLAFGASRAIELRALVSPMLKKQLSDTRLSADQQLEPGENGWFILTAAINDSWRLRWWLLSKAGDLEVLSPLDLRHAIGRRLSEAAQRYAAPPATARDAPRDGSPAQAAAKHR